jgi:Uncharacterized protein involved in copper resistance
MTATRQQPMLEVIAVSAEDALRAESGGADRIELVAAMNEGGLTPSVRTMVETIASVAIPVRVMIRPHSRSFRYDVPDLHEMVTSIAAARRAGADGVVLGVLDAENRVDKESLKRLLDAAEDMPVTFHRAFDETRDLDEAFEQLLEFPQIDRVLTSGGKPSVLAAEETIARLVERSRETAVRIMAGSGLSEESVAGFVARTGVGEVHFGRGVRCGMRADAPVDPGKVRRIKQLLAESWKTVTRDNGETKARKT